MAAPRFILRSKTPALASNSGTSRAPRNDAARSKTHLPAAQTVPEESNAEQIKPNGLAPKKRKGTLSAAEQIEETELAPQQNRRISQAETFETSFKASENASRNVFATKTSAAGNAFLPHSPAAHLHRLSASEQEKTTPRNRVNALATAFLVKDSNQDLFSFGEALQSLVEKVEAGAYRQRDIRIPLGQLEFPNDKALAQLFAPDSQIKDADIDLKGMRKALLNLMQRLSHTQGDAIILPSWPVRIKELSALWHLQDAQLQGHLPTVQRWAEILLLAAPEGPFADFAQSQLPDDGYESAEKIQAVKKALFKSGEVYALCAGMKKLAQTFASQASSQSSMNGDAKYKKKNAQKLQVELEKLPSPDASDLKVLWTDAGAKMRQNLHQGLQELAAEYPDAFLFEHQTLKEAALYALVLEVQFAAESGATNKGDLHLAAQNLIDAFPQSERSQWVAQLMLE